MGASFGTAALSLADVEDSRRGHPLVDLSDWARRRGLEPRGSALMGAYVGVLPTWPEYTFNVSVGALPGGRHGVIAHELHELPMRPGGGSGIDVPGTYYAVRGTPRQGLGAFLGLTGDDRPNEPFAANAVWAPTTHVAVRAPDAALLAPFLVMPVSPLPGTRDLGDVGLPGMGLFRDRFIDDRLRAAIFSPELAAALGQAGGEWRRLEVTYGAVSLRVNGYVTDEGRLEALVAATTAIADRLGAIYAGWTLERPFSDQLPAPDPSRYPPGFPQPSEMEDESFTLAAEARGLIREDPMELHRSWPGLPVPGVGYGLMAGAVEGLPGPGRLLWTIHGGRTWGSYRGAVLVPVGEGPRPPVGGRLDPSTDMYLEVLGDLACCWNRLRGIGRLDSALLGPRAAATLANAGLTPL